MVSDRAELIRQLSADGVLILVLMEYGLWRNSKFGKNVSAES